MEKIKKFNKAMNALLLEVDESIVKDIKQICLDAIREQSIKFGLFIMEENGLTYLKKDCWGREKDGSIELEQREYSTDEIYDEVFLSKTEA